jgi:ABC-2 type transport system permease protein
MSVMQNPQFAEQESILSTKAEAMIVSADWNGIFLIITQGMGVGGIIIFGFLVSWIFGREYSENTIKDLLSLPMPKTKIINAKFIVYVLWAISLGIVNLILGIIIGLLLQFNGFENYEILNLIKTYFLTMAMTILLGTPIAFFSMLGKGYLAPLGIVVLTVVFSQIIGALGLGEFFPWAVPALYSGMTGNVDLKPISYILLIVASIIGYCITVLYWKNTDHSK